MNIYVIPAIIAFLVNVYILFNINKQKKPSNTFIALVLIFLIHHTSEILSFIEFFKNRYLNSVLRIYYASTIVLIYSVIHYSLDVSEVSTKKYNRILIIPTILISILVLLTDKIILGTTPLNYVMTAIKGDWYILFQAFAVTLLIGAIATLIYGYKRSTNSSTQLKCIDTLVALLPLIVISISIILLMALGFKINAIALLPVASCLFIYLTMKSESKHKLPHIKQYFPFPNHQDHSREIIELYNKYQRDEILYRECINEIEKILVIQKYKDNNNNVSATAKSMGMPRSSLYSIFNRLKVDIKEQ